MVAPLTVEDLKGNPRRLRKEALVRRVLFAAAGLSVVVSALIVFALVGKAWSFVAGSEEGALYTAGLFPVRRPGKVSPGVRAMIRRALLTSRVRGAALKSSGKLVGGWDKVITLPSKRLKPGYYVYGARLVAEMNLARKATYIGVPFAVGTPKRSRR